MSRRQVLLLLALASVSGVAVVLLASPGERRATHAIAVTVGEVTSLGSGKALDFGVLTPGQSAARSLNFSNNFLIPLTVEMSTSGETAQWVSLETGSFRLGPFARKRATVSVAIPAGVAPRAYQGTVNVVSRRRLFD